MDLRIIPWGFGRGRWDHFRVADSVGATVCKHRFRTDAEKCIEQRYAGSDRCIDMVTPVSLELKRRLAELSSLASAAARQERTPESLIATVELVRATADAIIASIAPKRPVSPAVDMVGIAKSALGMKS